MATYKNHRTMSNDGRVPANNGSEDKAGSHPRVLIFSQRNLSPRTLFRAPHYEFEDIICQIDAAEILAPRGEKWFKAGYQAAMHLAWHCPVILNPGVEKSVVTRNYDLLFAVCGSPADLLMVNTVGNWREFAKVSVCLLDELWVKELSAARHFVELLKKFDVIVLYYSQSVRAVGEAAGRKCVFMPPGIDAILFSPYPEMPKRTVDVYSIGRRSEKTHRALIKMGEDLGLFYLHDSVSGDHAINLKDHRRLFANVAKRSRYFIVNPALIDRPEKRGTQMEIGNRFFEGAAAGAVMIGERPGNEEFKQLFDWPDVVMDLPFDSTDIDAVIKRVDSEPEWQEEMRRNNVVNTLLRHDWVYRWECILQAAGLPPMEGIFKRKERLRRLATDVSASRFASADIASELTYAGGSRKVT